MTTRYFVKLVVERDCSSCNGRGYPLVMEKSNPYPETCPECKGKKKLWYRLAYTHAKSYEEALKKLLARLSQRWGLSIDDQYFLVWDKKANTSPINVSRAVAYRLKENVKRIMLREFKRKNRF